LGEGLKKKKEEGEGSEERRGKSNEKLRKRKEMGPFQRSSSGKKLKGSVLYSLGGLEVENKETGTRGGLVGR